MKHHSKLIPGAGFVTALLLAGSASAVQITHGGVTLFDDTFENQDVDGTPPETADITPGGNGGDGWFATNTTANPLAIETLANPTEPGANDGEKFVRLDNAGDRLDAIFTFVATNDVTVNFAAYVSSASFGSEASRIRMQLRTGGDVSTEIRWACDGSHAISTAAGGNTGLTFVPDQWQDYTVVYDYNTTGGGQPADDTVTITVDGNTSVIATTILQNTSIDTASWRLVGDNVAQFFLDDLGPPPTPVDFTQVAQPGTVSMCFTSKVDNVYTLQGTTDLLNSGLWSNVGANVTGDGNPRYLFDIDSAPALKAYRIVGE